jgi:hypothetical protein
MKPISLILSETVILIVLTCCKQQGESLPSDAFIGEWYTVKGDLDTYSFLKDSNNFIYVGTRNMHPVVFGTWKTVNDSFIMNTDNGSSSSYRYTLINDTLIFNSGEQVYTRTEPLEVRFPEVKILETLADDFAILKFSAPSKAELNWASSADKAGNSQNTSLIGYTISSGIEASDQVLSEIYTSLEEYGFEPDTTFVMNDCKFYSDGNQVINVSSIRTAVSKNNSATIKITSGYILK